MRARRARVRYNSPMNPDKYKRRRAAPDGRSRSKIAAEAARRLHARLAPAPGETHLREATEAEYYAAKRRAAAVLGLVVRPGDLPSDSEIREQVLALVRSQVDPPTEDEEEGEALEALRLADHLDRFAIYRMRLGPLERVKQDPRWHPEGDALYHSLQVFERAREVRPYDEEFLLAALLHDVGKAIDPRDPGRAAVESLQGAISDRTAWLIEHHGKSREYLDRTLNPKVRRLIDESGWVDDLLLLRELDEAGRSPGEPVGTVDAALDYLKGLESEAYLTDSGQSSGPNSE